MRKSPYRHRVRSHTRFGRRVNSYIRGKGELHKVRQTITRKLKKEHKPRQTQGTFSLEDKMKRLEEIRKEVAPTMISWEVLRKEYGIREFTDDEAMEYKREYRDKYPHIKYYGQYGLGFEKSVSTPKEKVLDVYTYTRGELLRIVKMAQRLDIQPENIDWRTADQIHRVIVTADPNKIKRLKNYAKTCDVRSIKVR